MEKEFYIYIVANKRNGTLYIGVTSNLIKRIYEHRTNAVQGFTRKYSVHRLVYFEKHESSISAINREKRLKFWKRKWKLALIEKFNPDWRDLYFDITGSCGQAAGRR
ncbi:MAG: GIY-YIG nuclease family protein [Aestuariibacter sp.]